MRYIKPLILFFFLINFLSVVNGQNTQYSEGKIESLGNKVLAHGDSLAISTFNKFEESEVFSIEFFDLSYKLASFFRYANKRDLQFEFLQIIISNKGHYPESDKWPRLGSKSYFLLADFFEKTNKLDLAIENYIISADEYERAYGISNFNIPLINYKIADLYRAKYQYEGAIQYYKKNIALLKVLGTYEEAKLLQQISHCYLHLKEPDIAHRYINLALDIHKGDSSSNKTELARVYNTIGAIHESKEEWQKALSFFNKAKSMHLSLEGKGSLKVAFYNNSIGNIYLAIPRYDSAMLYYKESLAIRKKYLPKIHKELTHSYYNVGYTFSKLGLLDSALVYCDKSIVSNLGYLLDSLSGSLNPKSFPVSKKDLIVSLTDKSEYYLLQFLVHGNDKSYIEKSYNAINLALEYSNHIISEISTYYSDLSWILFEKRLLNLAVEIFHLYEESYDNSVNFSLFSSNIKKNRIHNKYFDLFSSLKNNSQFSNNELFQISKQQHSQALVDKGVGCIDPQNSFESSITKNPFHSVDRNSIINTDDLLGEIQSNMQNHQTVVDFIVCDSMLITHVISKDTIVKVITSIPDMEKNVDSFLSDIKKLSDIDSSSRKLYKSLIHPIMEYLNTSDLIIIPDEYLFRVPFEAIKIASYGNSKYLIDSFVVSYAYSFHNILRNNMPTREDFEYTYTGWTPYSEEPEEVVLTSLEDTWYSYG